MPCCTCTPHKSCGASQQLSNGVLGSSRNAVGAELHGFECACSMHHMEGCTRPPRRLFGLKLGAKDAQRPWLLPYKAMPCACFGRFSGPFERFSVPKFDFECDSWQKTRKPPHKAPCFHGCPCAYTPGVCCQSMGSDGAVWGLYEPRQRADVRLPWWLGVAPTDNSAKSG